MPPHTVMEMDNSQKLPIFAARLDHQEDIRETARKVKCALVGDVAVGKTSLVVSYTTNGYPTEYLPTAFDNYSVMVSMDNKPIRLQLCDTAGRDDFDSLRPLCYPGMNVFVLCFSVVSPTSFHNVSEKWVPEIRTHCPQVPTLLIGTQSDLRNDVKVLIDLAKFKEKPISEDEAVSLAAQLGTEYVECSALTQKNLKHVFDTAILRAMAFADAGAARVFNRSKSLLHNSKRSKCKPTADRMTSAKLAACNTSSKSSAWKRFCCLM